MKALERLIRPRSVAIIGASAEPEKLTGRPLAYLEKYGYRQAIYPVNPRYRSLGGHPCYPDVASLPRRLRLLASLGFGSVPNKVAMPPRLRVLSFLRT